MGLGLLSAASSVASATFFIFSEISGNKRDRLVLDAAAAAEETVEATEVRDAENEYGTYREAGFIFGSISLGLGLLTGGLTPFVVWEE